MTLESLQDYVKFIDASGNDDTDNTQMKCNQILSAQFRLPQSQSPDYKELKKTSPHHNRAPGYTQYSYTYNQVYGSGMSLYIRPAYYDSLDSSSSQAPFSALTMFSGKLNYFKNRLAIRQFDFVAIESVNTGHTGLAGDNGDAWKLRLSAEQQNLSCEDCLIFRAQGDIGIAQPFGDKNNIGVYIGGALQNNRNDYGAFYPKASLFTNLTLSPDLKIRGLYEKRYHFDSRHNEETIIQIEGRYQLSHNFDTRLAIENNKTTEFSLSLGYYW